MHKDNRAYKTGSQFFLLSSFSINVLLWDLVKSSPLTTSNLSQR